MIRISDIMDKEVINVKNGKRMGYITDIDMDINEGKIISFSIVGDGGINLFSRGSENQVVFWNDILKIGYDTIIVNQGSDNSLEDFNI
ncbi:MAG: YlmC/YmxH family sporulation protein [Peptostreptococcaceae bacterium]|jgi:YlmC/YmxH family sporulation protein|nr:YlmC/YmxH family sporulation protein [Peptostreptococcaceae bacterium]MBQ1793870.1 YlmC/YmxH family sporulation protein [Peptostreptococcaceae bacterium]